jgi:hypothetical protein
MVLGDCFFDGFGGGGIALGPLFYTVFWCKINDCRLLSVDGFFGANC